MAILRAQLQGIGRPSHYLLQDGTLTTGLHGIYDGIAETAADLTDNRTAVFSPGSILYCLADQKLYVKTGVDQWQEVAE